jgi:hypothetical protein
MKIEQENLNRKGIALLYRAEKKFGKCPYHPETV